MSRELVAICESSKCNVATLCQFVHRFINDNYEANSNFIVSSTLSWSENK